MKFYQLPRLFCHTCGGPIEITTRGSAIELICESCQSFDGTTVDNLPTIEIETDTDAPKPVKKAVGRE